MEHGEKRYYGVFGHKCPFCGDFQAWLYYSEHCGQELCYTCWRDEDAFFKHGDEGEATVKHEATS